MSGVLYRSLPGRGQSALTRHSLWLAPDHLLSVEDYVVKQRYRRYALTDVQLLRTRDTSRHVLSVALTSVFAAASLVFAVLSLSAAGKLAWLACGMALGGALARELYLGPTCKTTLYTAAGQTHLPSLGRRRSAARALRLLQSAALQAQGSMNADGSNTLELAANLMPRPLAEPTRDSVATEPPRSRPTWGVALCFVAWTSALLQLLLMLVGGRPLATVTALAVLTTFVIAIATAATTHGGRMRAAAIGGVAAGVLGMSGVWMMELVAGLRQSYAPAIPRVGSLQLLAAPPELRDPLPWLLLLATLMAAVTAGVQSSRALLSKST